MKTIPKIIETNWSTDIFCSFSSTISGIIPTKAIYKKPPIVKGNIIELLLWPWLSLWWWSWWPRWCWWRESIFSWLFSKYLLTTWSLDPHDWLLEVKANAKVATNAPVNAVINYFFITKLYNKFICIFISKNQNDF